MQRPRKMLMRHRPRTRTQHLLKMLMLHRLRTRTQHLPKMHTVPLPRIAMQPPKTIMVLLPTKLLRAKTSPNKLRRNPNAKSLKQKQKPKPRLSRKGTAVLIIMRTPGHRYPHRLRRPRGYGHAVVRQLRARSLLSSHQQPMMRMAIVTRRHLQPQRQGRMAPQRTAITLMLPLHRLQLRRVNNRLTIQKPLMHTTPMLHQLY